MKELQHEPGETMEVRLGRLLVEIASRLSGPEAETPWDLAAQLAQLAELKTQRQINGSQAVALAVMAPLLERLTAAAASVELEQVAALVVRYGIGPVVIEGHRNAELAESLVLLAALLERLQAVSEGDASVSFMRRVIAVMLTVVRDGTALLSGRLHAIKVLQRLLLSAEHGDALRDGAMGLLAIARDNSLAEEQRWLRYNAFEAVGIVLDGRRRSDNDAWSEGVATLLAVLRDVESDKESRYHASLALGHALTGNSLGDDSDGGIEDLWSQGVEALLGLLKDSLLEWRSRSGAGAALSFALAGASGHFWGEGVSVLLETIKDRSLHVKLRANLSGVLASVLDGAGTREECVAMWAVAVDELSRLTRDVTEDNWLRNRAVDSLGCALEGASGGIGAEAWRRSVTSMLEVMANTELDRELRGSVAMAVGTALKSVDEQSPMMHEAVDGLLHVLEDRWMDTSIRVRVLWALGLALQGCVDSDNEDWQRGTRELWKELRDPGYYCWTYKCAAQAMSFALRCVRGEAWTQGFERLLGAAANISWTHESRKSAAKAVGMLISDCAASIIAKEGRDEDQLATALGLVLAEVQRNPDDPFLAQSVLSWIKDIVDLPRVLLHCPHSRSYISTIMIHLRDHSSSTSTSASTAATAALYLNPTEIASLHHILAQTTH